MARTDEQKQILEHLFSMMQEWRSLCNWLLYGVKFLSKIFHCHFDCDSLFPMAVITSSNYNQRNCFSFFYPIFSKIVRKHI